MSVITDHLEYLLKQAQSPIWGGYVNMLKTLESMFQSPKHWILEFLQNAEDASATNFAIRLDSSSIQILNNGNPFKQDDFYAVCDVNSRKLPSLGLRGYIGIGFKSIFRITNNVEIHSGTFSFAFDRSYWNEYVQKNGLLFSKWPWEILPIEISPKSFPEGYTTAFFIPLGSAEGLSALKEIDDYLLSYSFPKELSYMFPKEIILLVDKVKIIQVESTNQSFTIVKEPKASEQTGYGKKESCKITKQFGGQESPEESNYLVFRTSVTVDDDVRLDPDTERVRRSEITERDIGLVFQLDCDGNIMPLEGTLSGVYSFLPIEGEQTGMPFGIFGDFIPSPGRDQINYSAKWNQWMCQQIVKFFKTVVENELLKNLHFKFFPAQAFDDIKYSSRGGPFWNANLRQPILDFLSGIPIFADENQDLHKQNELFKVKPDVSNLFSTETLQKAIGKKLPHPSLLDLQLIKQNIPEIGIYDVLHNKELIESIKNDTEKLISLYGQIEKLENYWIKGRPQGRGTRDVPLRLIPFVLGNDNQLHAPEQVKLLQDVAEIPPFIDMGKINTKIPLHTEIAKNETAVSQLKRCDMEVIGIQKTIDNVKDLVHDISNNPSYLQLLDTLVEASLWLIAHDVSKLDKLLDQSGTLQLPENVFIPYGHLDWQPLWDANMLPGYFPLSSKYFELAGKYGLEVEAMKQCLQEMKVHGFSKEYDARLITVAGETIAEKYLESKGHIPKNVTDHDKLGYDLYCQGHCNQVFEVKGMSEPSDVSLQASQVDKAKELGEKYILVCVYNIPEDPTKIVFKEIPDPQQIWVAEEKARVPKKK